MHVINRDGFLNAVEHQFPIFKEFRNNACHITAMFEHRTGHHAHQADIGAAIDKRDLVVGEAFSETGCGFEISRIIARSRSTIDTNRRNSGHERPFDPR